MVEGIVSLSEEFPGKEWRLSALTDIDEYETAVTLSDKGPRHFLCFELCYWWMVRWLGLCRCKATQSLCHCLPTSAAVKGFYPAYPPPCRGLYITNVFVCKKYVWSTVLCRGQESGPCNIPCRLCWWDIAHFSTSCNSLPGSVAAVSVWKGSVNSTATWNMNLLPLPWWLVECTPIVTGAISNPPPPAAWVIFFSSSKPSTEVVGTVDTSFFPANFKCLCGLEHWAIIYDWDTDYVCFNFDLWLLVFKRATDQCEAEIIQLQCCQQLLVKGLD